jgi:hypothetical protein
VPQAHRSILHEATANLANSVQRVFGDTGEVNSNEENHNTSESADLMPRSRGLIFLPRNGSSDRNATNRSAKSAASRRRPTNATQFVGKIVSLNGTRYILRDDANDTWYHPDDQKSAGKFRGKIVAITGTLDGRFDMIHIHSIQESKS